MSESLERLGLGQIRVQERRGLGTWTPTSHTSERRKGQGPRPLGLREEEGLGAWAPGSEGGGGPGLPGLRKEEVGAWAPRTPGSEEGGAERPGLLSLGGGEEDGDS